MIGFLKNTKIYKRIFHSRLLNPGIYVEIGLLEFLQVQLKNKAFNRFDLVVRLLAIENRYGKNDYGWDLYLKMQGHRTRGIPTHVSLTTYKKRFEALIESFAKTGFSPKYPIDANKKMALTDGAHRLACCIYFDVPKILVKQVDDWDTDYRIGWFKEHFEADEIGLILERFRRLDLPLESL